MNKVILLGRLTRDPEIRYTQGTNSTAVASFSVAVRRRFVREGEADCDFIEVKAFGKTAEFIQKYFTKGSWIAVSGSMRVESYTTRDGSTRWAHYVVADQVTFAGKSEAAPTNQPAAKAKSDRQFAKAQQAELGQEDFEEIDQDIEGEDDLPF